MSDKIQNVINTAQELDYLKDEYKNIKLWGSCPDGDVKFNDLMKWIGENEHFVEHAIKVSKDVIQL